MWPVGLDGELLEEQINIKFPNGISELQAKWDNNGGPDRTTIYRWRKGALPRSSGDYLKLCGLLNVDPFALLTVNDDDATDAIDRLLTVSDDISPSIPPAFSFARNFFGRQREWPPTKAMNQYYQNFKWHRMEFKHEAKGYKNYYKQLIIKPANEHFESLQVFHFAFRHPALFGKRWLQYGFIKRLLHKGSLIQVNGYRESIDIASLSSPIPVETHFGEGPAIFQIASIHPFYLEELNSKFPTKCLRFPG